MAKTPPSDSPALEQLLRRAAAPDIDSDEVHRSSELRSDGVAWVAAVFIAITQAVAFVGVPLYLWLVGASAAQWVTFAAMFVVTAMSITVGYHRLFTHRAFSAAWPVRLFVLLFGGAAFQMSALQWASEHRYHHKYEDTDGDPHDPHGIHHGFFWAHMGWVFVKVDPALDMNNVDDLRRDPLVMWQHKHYYAVATVMGFFFPMAMVAAWAALTGGSVPLALVGGLLIPATARIVAVHHITWFINSLAHTIGRRPYDSRSSSRDSSLLALLTFGEGYHNYHHAFQTDYRNGVRAWHWDPSKWTIWLLSRVGLAHGLRRIPAETIRMARIREKARQLEARLASRAEVSELQRSAETLLREIEERLEEVHLRCRVLLAETTKATNQKLEQSRQRALELKAELRQARREFRSTVKEWQAAHRRAMALALA